MNTMDMDFYSICPNGEPFLLYGENDFAKRTYKCLTEKGYCVKGYIDQKYSGYEEDQGIIRTDLKGVKKLQGGGYVIIICLQNGMFHDSVAQALHDEGMQKIIYLPMQMNRSLYIQNMYRRVYQLVKAFQYESIDRIPFYRVKKNSPFIIIDEWGDKISFWCPVHYLYSANDSMIMQNMPKHLDTAKSKLLEYADVSIQMNRPYMELFKWLNGQNADIDLYLTFMGCITDKEKELLLEDRKKLYHIYEEAFHYNMSFFTTSPSCGIWNSCGYFNMEDGKHRIHYLYSKGYRKMPVVVSIDDFEKFAEKYEGDDFH